MTRQEILNHPDKVSWQELSDYVRQALCDAGIEEYQTDSWLLLSHYFQITRSRFYLDRSQCVDCSTGKLEAFLELTEQRCRRVPLQYLTGQQCFMGLDFKVSPAVLIPRQDTEVLVETVLHYCKKHPVKSVLDVCTGSGCIAVSLSHYGHFQRVDATDLSKEALEVAQQNNSTLGASVHFYQGDLLEPVQACYDVIVSNPPYIEEEVIEGLAPEVKDHEPRLALSGGADGLDIYRRLIRDAAARLMPGGALFVEIGSSQWESVRRLFIQNGFCRPVLVKDLAGLDRVVWAELSQ